ncbi:MAG TPA: hypothetical protein DCR94_06060 [Firmicutes bacterium]|nr:hypothetical protein [Bacillota bacterium]
MLSNMKEEKITLIALVGVYLVGVASFVCFFFLGNPGLPLGWIFGGALMILAYLSIVFSSKAILNGATGKGVGTSFAVMFSLLRIILLAGGLFLSGFYTYKLQSNWLNVWTVFGGYLPLGIVTGITGFINSRKNKKEVE